jgi:peptidoglycan LD-endopeptidase LytH
MISIVRFLLWVIIIAILIAGIYTWLSGQQGRLGTGIHSLARDRQVIEWINNPAAHPDWAIQSGERCGQAPFQMPTSGYIGYLWDDSFRPGHRHQGIDIFGGDQPGETPVYAAADGYLTREEDWKSSLIIRIPSDPLQPGHQIWTYYTHMADLDGASLIAADFPPGTSELFIKAGTLLGHQGNYSGTPGNPVGVHLHFSIVQDDGQGKYKNELKIENSLDPSPYLGINLNAHNNNGEIPLCPSESNGDQP